MELIKQIDYIDGDRHYSIAEIIEIKDYIVVDIKEMSKDGDVLYQERVWFSYDNTPFKLTENDIAIFFAEPEEIVEEVEVIDE